MASSLSNLKTPLHFHSFKTPFSFRSSSRFIPSFSYPRLFRSSISSLKAASASSSSSDSAADNLLQKPVLSQGKGIVEEQSCYDELEQEEDKWVDWEDQILEDTVPLVRFVRMILHSGMWVFVTIIHKDNYVYFILFIVFHLTFMQFKH